MKFSVWWTKWLEVKQTIDSFVITTAVGEANIEHRCYTYDAEGIKSVSPPNHLVTQHRLNGHQRWIMMHGDHDLWTDGSYAQVTVMFTSTQTWRLSEQRWARIEDSRVIVQGDGDSDHYIGGSYAQTTVMLAST